MARVQGLAGPHLFYLMTLERKKIENVGFRLRTIEETDIDELRNWKNQNKNSFFLRDDITQEQQSLWFKHYLERENDWMFVVEQEVMQDREKIGCMGFRLLADEGCVDAYNIIRSKRIEPATFTMSDAFLAMLTFADQLYETLPIRCKVLSENPAVQWYERNGFEKVTLVDNYFLMQLDKVKLNDLKIK